MMTFVNVRDYIYTGGWEGGDSEGVWVVPRICIERFKHR